MVLRADCRQTERLVQLPSKYVATFGTPKSMGFLKSTASFRWILDEIFQTIPKPWGFGEFVLTIHPMSGPTEIRGSLWLRFGPPFPSAFSSLCQCGIRRVVKLRKTMTEMEFVRWLLQANLPEWTNNTYVQPVKFYMMLFQIRNEIYVYIRIYIHMAYSLTFRM